MTNSLTRFAESIYIGTYKSKRAKTKQNARQDVK